MCWAFHIRWCEGGMGGHVEIACFKSVEERQRGQRPICSRVGNMYGWLKEDDCVGFVMS